MLKACLYADINDSGGVIRLRNSVQHVQMVIICEVHTPTRSTLHAIVQSRYLRHAAEAAGATASLSASTGTTSIPCHPDVPRRVTPVGQGLQVQCAEHGTWQYSSLW